MTTLNHATTASLLAEFVRLAGRTFRFKGRKTGSLSRPWEPVMGDCYRGDRVVRLCVKYEDGTRKSFDFHTDGRLLKLDDHFKVVGTLYDMSVVVLPTEPPQGYASPDSVDDSQRRHLDRNLRGVFA